MPENESTLDDILAKAGGPKKASGDEGSVEMHSLSERLEAEKARAAKCAAKKPFGGVRMTRVVPPGAGGG